MNKIVLATPIYPPSSGGPATHSKKLKEYFDNRAELFIFEKLNRLPPGIRHFVAFLQIFRLTLFSKIVFALDGFSVAIPAVLVGKILRVPVILRVGGDLVHEQYVEQGHLLPMNIFYEKFEKKQLQLSKTLKFKMFLQKFVIKNAAGIIFNSDWQKEMYSRNYFFPKDKNGKDNVWVLYNPIDKLIPETNKVITYNHSGENLVLTSITRHVPFKNLKMIEEVVDEINRENILNKRVVFDTKNGSYTDVIERIFKSDAYITGAISDIAPNQLLEALILGVPSICTKNTGYFNLLNKEKGVIFIDTQNKSEIKKAIVEVLNKETNAQMRESLAKFSWPHTWEKYFSSYEEIINFFVKP